MLAYFVIIIGLYCSNEVLKNIPSGTGSIFRKLVVLALGLFLCGGYTTGTDWRVYEVFYNDLTMETAPTYILFLEPGFVIYCLIGKLCHLDFWVFLIVTKLTTYFVFISCLKANIEKHYFFLGLTFFVTFYGFFFWIDNPLRNLIAFAIFLTGVPFLLKRKAWAYVLVVLIASTFHYSAIVLLLFIFVQDRRFSNTSIIIIFLIVNVVFLSPKVLFFILQMLFGGIPILSRKVLEYTSGENSAGSGKLFSFGLVIHTIFFLIFLRTKERIYKLNNGVMLFNCAILYILLFRVGLTITVLMRISMYFAVFYSILVGYSPSLFVRESKPAYSLYFLLLCLLVGYTSLSSDSRYVPYTSYFRYIGGEKPSFEQRAEYNNLNSPYPPIRD